MSRISFSPSTLLAPVPVVMVSCAGKEPRKIETRPNIVTVAWAGTINSEPPMVSISVRKSRHSHQLICDTQEFVINLVSEKLAKACDFCGVRSGDKYDKFEEMKLHPVEMEKLRYAPAIEESPLSLGCVVRDIIELGSHDMFLAEIVSVAADTALIDKNGKLCLDKAGLISFSHGEYFKTGEKMGFFGYSVASKAAMKRRMPGKTVKKKEQGKSSEKKARSVQSERSKKSVKTGKKK